MAVHKAKVIGALEVGGVAPGGTVELDDEQVNIQVLVSAQLVELVPEKKQPQKPADKKGDD